MKALSLLFFLGLLTSCHTLDQVSMQTDRHADPFLVREEGIDTRDVKVWVDNLSLTEYIHSSPADVYDTLVWIDSVYNRFGGWGAAKYPDASIRLQWINFQNSKNVVVQFGTFHLNHRTLLSEIEEQYPVAFSRMRPHNYIKKDTHTSVAVDQVIIPDVSGEGILTLYFQDGKLLAGSIINHDEEIRNELLRAYTGG